MPSLTTSSSSPTDGDKLTLTCNPPSHSSVNKYQFFKDGKSVGNPGSSKTYTVNSVTFTNAGGYTCKAFVDTVGSDSSNRVTVKGMFILSYLYWFYSETETNEGFKCKKNNIFICQVKHKHAHIK